MRVALSIAVALFSTLATAIESAAQQSFNKELKYKLRFELSGLEVSMMAANNEIAQLREDKVHIDNDLLNMEDWGKNQEQQKNEYYKRVIEATQKIADTQARVDLEKEKGKSTLIRYHRVKSLLGYIFGLLLAVVYMRLGAQLISSLAATFAGPWAFLLRFAGPVAAFGLGYIAVNLFF